jgi:hypothetical protein
MDVTQIRQSPPPWQWNYEFYNWCEVPDRRSFRRRKFAKPANLYFSLLFPYLHLTDDIGSRVSVRQTVLIVKGLQGEEVMNNIRI